MPNLDLFQPPGVAPSLTFTKESTRETMAKTGIIIVAAILITVVGVVGQRTGTDRELNRLISETNDGRNH